MRNNRIEKVTAAIAFIEAHLTEKLDLNAVASAVHYSKYHLHRVFKLEPMERHGAVPEVIFCADRQAQLVKMRERIAAFLKGNGVSLGIILKTNCAARAVYEQLSSEFDVQLISPDSTRFASGISIASIQMSKGLEFDEVLVPDVGATHYCTESDRSLLYIACTRAMHRLTLLYTDELSTLVPAQDTHAPRAQGG